MTNRKKSMKAFCGIKSQNENGKPFLYTVNTRPSRCHGQHRTHLCYWRSRFPRDDKNP